MGRPDDDHADRKNLLRMLVQQVTLTPIDTPQRLTRIQVLWCTGAVSDLTVPRPRWTTTYTSTKEALVLEQFSGGFTASSAALRTS